MKRIFALVVLALLLLPSGWIWAQDDGGELEPLVITAPRLKLHADDAIDPQINMFLLHLLRDKQSSRASQQGGEIGSLNNLSGFTTLDGYNLKTRYTQLGFLLIEGLAGTTDFDLANQLEIDARGGDAQLRAIALMALAYTHDMRYLPLFQSALADANVGVRFAAIEALQILGDTSSQFTIANAGHGDPSLAVQMYASAVIWRSGDIFGRENLLRLYQSSDWFVRAMAAHYLGLFGRGDEYRRLMQQLSVETNPTVKAELCSSLIRLQAYKDQ